MELPRPLYWTRAGSSAQRPRRRRRWSHSSRGLTFLGATLALLVPVWARATESSLTPYRLSAPLAPSVRLDPDYRSGRRERTAGIIITAAGGSAGLGMVALAVSFYRSSHGGSEQPLAARIGWGVLSGTVLISSLAVGLSMWASGQQRMDHAAKQYSSHRGMPSVDVAAGPNGGAVRASWRF